MPDVTPTQVVPHDEPEHVQTARVTLAEANAAIAKGMKRMDAFAPAEGEEPSADYLAAREAVHAAQELANEAAKTKGEAFAELVNGPAPHGEVHEGIA